MGNHGSPDLSEAASPWSGYENYDYKSYWEPQSGPITTGYEDSAERVVIRKMLPPQGARLVDLGANFGRLVPEFGNFAVVLLVDGARSAMSQARALWRRQGIDCAVCDASSAPFPARTIDVAMCVRVLHHNPEIEPIFQEAARILKPGGLLIFSYANKRNAKHLLLAVAGRSRNRVADAAPIRLRDGTYNFHPKHIDQLLARHRFKKELQLGTGSLRDPFVAKLLTTSAMVLVDSMIQHIMGFLCLSPSIFIRARSAFLPAD